MNILNDMLAGVGWTLQSYVQFGKNNYYPPLPNGHKLFVHDRRRVAVRAAMAMADNGDIVVSIFSPIVKHTNLRNFTLLESIE